MQKTKSYFLSKKSIHIYILYLWVTFLIMNAITYDYTFFLIGKYGKLVVSVIGIIMFQKSYSQFRNFINKNLFIVIFWLLCIVFTILRVLYKGLNIQLIQNNVLFIVFIYFIYLLSLEFRKKHIIPNLAFFKSFSKVINFNLFFWTLIAVVFSFNIWHTLEDRVGLGLFYENYLQLGIFACVGAIVNFALLKFYKKKKKRKIFLMFFLMYTLLVILSNSRNSQFVLFIFILLSVLPFIKNLIVKYIYIFVSITVFLGIVYFSSNLLLNDYISNFTTGRSIIWYMIYEYYSQTSIFLGEGIFGLNNTILSDNLSSNYYFQRVDFLYFHSSYVEVFCASGLIGFVFFMWYIIKSLRAKMKYSIVVIIICILAGGGFESYLIQPTILISFLFWYFMLSINQRRWKKVKLKDNFPKPVMP